jgi:integrase
VPKVPTPAARTNTVEQSTIDAYLAVAPPHLRAYLLLCHDAALRAQTALNVTHTEYQGGTITVRTKRGRVVSVPCSPRLAQALDAAPKVQGVGLVSLLAGRSEDYGYTAIYLQLRALAEAHELPAIRLHDLRRTMARKAYSVTSDLRVVQALLGHSTLGATMHYLEPVVLRTSPEVVNAAIERGTL